jgi:hypothetical protein
MHFDHLLGQESGTTDPANIHHETKASSLTTGIISR